MCSYVCPFIIQCVFMQITRTNFGDICLPLPIICIASSVSLYYCMVEIHVEREASNNLLNNYIGRPSPIYLADNLSREIGNAKIWLKREDLNHTGSHKINNSLGQALLAKKWVNLE